MHERESVSLQNLGSGAAIELFDTELQRVLDNIVDENTKPTTIREVTLKIKIKPDEDRESGSVEIQASSKLAPVHPYPTQILIGNQRGQGVATEWNPKQLHAFKDQPQPQDGKVIPMKGVEAND